LIGRGWTGNVNVAAGSKEYDEDQWEPAESQGEGGIEVDFRPESWPLNLFVGFSVSSGEIGYFLGGTKIAEMETEKGRLRKLNMKCSIAMEISLRRISK